MSFVGNLSFDYHYEAINSSASAVSISHFKGFHSFHFDHLLPFDYLTALKTVSFENVNDLFLGIDHFKKYDNWYFKLNFAEII